MKKVPTILFRIIALPFVSGIIIIFHIRMALFGIYNFLLYGGEWMSHTQTTGPWIMDILDQLKKNHPKSDN